jgi:ABC-type proline/glycine betaine transport system permease subunit
LTLVDSSVLIPLVIGVPVVILLAEKPLTRQP